MTSSTDLSRDDERTRVEPSSGMTGDSGPASSPSDDGDDGPARGDQVGRYIVVDRLGRGGMGQVFAAYDPKLDRRVALKLLELRGRDGDRGRDRMLREAQALAKLAHPNVVTVFDAGAHGQHVFIAMEEIRGATLKDWLAERTRSWVEIVDVMRAVGRGLAAAHAEGLVHRDFKPANVMIGEDGRARVLDFGLARRYEGGASEDEAPRSEAPRSEAPRLDGESLRELDGESRRELSSLERSGSSLDLALTQTGMVMGTPAFMAPEQFVSEPIDARTDQFAFCVVLHRALYGVAPFEGKDYRALAKAVVQGKRVALPRSAKVPRMIRQAIDRGLRVDKDDRFPRLEPLLDVLDRARGARRRRAWQVGGVALAGAVVLAVVGRPAEAPLASPCEGLEQRLIGSWDGERRDAIVAAFSRSAAPSAADASTRVQEVLDAYAAGWVDARQDACEATHVRHEQSEALMDLRVSCLEGRRRDLTALVDVLAAADDEVVEHAVDAAQQLRGLAWCSDTGALQADVPPPEDAAARAEVDRIQGMLATVRALLLAGRFEAGLEQAEPLLVQARALGHAGTVAEVARVVGMLEQRARRIEPAIEHLDEALWAAIESGHLREQIWALSDLVTAEANHRADAGGAPRHLRHAEAVLTRLGNAPALAAVVALQTGTMHMRRREWEQADVAYRRAAELAGDQPQAQATKLSAMSNLAASLAVRGRVDAARTEAQAALEIAVSNLGELHPKTYKIRHNLAHMALDAGDPEDAIRELGRVLELQEQTLGAEHPMLGQTLGALANAYREQGDWEAVLRAGQRALAIKRKTMGPDDASVGISVNNVAEALQHTGKLEDSLAHYEEALRIFGDGPERLYVLSGMADVQQRLGKNDQAQVTLQEALGRLESVLSNDKDRGLLCFELARVAWAVGDRERAAGLVSDARASLVAAEGDTSRSQAELEAWVAEHPGPASAAKER